MKDDQTKEAVLTPALRQVWNDLACICRQGGYASINVATVARRKAIIAVDEILRAHACDDGLAASADAVRRGRWPGNGAVIDQDHADFLDREVTRLRSDNERLRAALDQVGESSPAPVGGFRRPVRESEQ
jgi:hypothetical protein